MKITNRCLFALTSSALMLFTSNTLADPVSTKNTPEQADTHTVQIEWVEPEKFRDVRHPSISRRSYREQVLEQLEEYLQELGTKLPEGYALTLKVTDLDLAGQILPASFAGIGTNFNDVRVVKHIDIPRMSFSYQLSDKQGQVVKDEEVKLKDMSFLHRSNVGIRNDTLKYEKSMLKRWFNQTFAEQIVTS